MRQTVEINQEKYQFNRWRIPYGGITLPALAGGEKQVLPAEAIFRNKNGLEIGLSPNHPRLRSLQDIQVKNCLIEFMTRL